MSLPSQILRFLQYLSNAWHHNWTLIPKPLSLKIHQKRHQGIWIAQNYLQIEWYSLIQNKETYCILLKWFVIFSHGTFIGDTSKNEGTSNGQNNVSERDYASAMNVISGVKTSVHDISSLDADSVPKMGVHISPDLEIKLERVCR